MLLFLWVSFVFTVVVVVFTVTVAVVVYVFVNPETLLYSLVSNYPSLKYRVLLFKYNLYVAKAQEQLTVSLKVYFSLLSQLEHKNFTSYSIYWHPVASKVHSFILLLHYTSHLYYFNPT